MHVRVEFGVSAEAFSFSLSLPRCFINKLSGHSLSLELLASA